MKEECWRCKFWREVKRQTGDGIEDANGLCKRYPPQFNPQARSEAFDADMLEEPSVDWEWWSQPVTHGTDWCGEFIEKE